MSRETAMSTGTHGVLQPTSLPSESAKSRVIRPTVISVPPTQSNVLRMLGSACAGGSGMTKNPAVMAAAAMMPKIQKTHLQLRYSIITPPSKTLAFLRQRGLIYIRRCSLPRHPETRRPQSSQRQYLSPCRVGKSFQGCPMRWETW